MDASAWVCLVVLLAIGVPIGVFAIRGRRNRPGPPKPPPPTAHQDDWGRHP